MTQEMKIWSIQHQEEMRTNASARTRKASQPVSDEDVRTAIDDARLLGVKNKKELIKIGKYVLQAHLKRNIKNASEMIENVLS